MKTKHLKIFLGDLWTLRNRSLNLNLKKYWPASIIILQARKLSPKRWKELDQGHQGVIGRSFVKNCVCVCVWVRAHMWVYVCLCVCAYNIVCACLVSFVFNFETMCCAFLKGCVTLILLGQMHYSCHVRIYSFLYSVHWRTYSPIQHGKRKTNRPTKKENKTKTNPLVHAKMVCNVKDKISSIE